MHSTIHSIALIDNTGIFVIDYVNLDVHMPTKNIERIAMLRKIPIYL